MDLLEQYTLQQIVISCCITVTVLIAIWECGKKLGEIGNAYFNKKHRKKEIEKQVLDAVANDGEQDKAITALVGILKVQIRHSIVRIAEESLCGELAISLEMDKDEVRDYIKETVEF